MLCLVLSLSGKMVKWRKERNAVFWEPEMRSSHQSFRSAAQTQMTDRTSAALEMACVPASFHPRKRGLATSEIACHFKSLCTNSKNRCCFGGGGELPIKAIYTSVPPVYGWLVDLPML